MPKEHPALAKRPASTRSRVTNGSSLLPGVDGRSPLARRYRDLVITLTSDQGGADHLSEARLQLVRRFAAAACLAEDMEAKLVGGKSIDLAEHATLCSTLVRLASRIGIDRRSRNITPTLSDYLVSKQIDIDAEPAE